MKKLFEIHLKPEAFQNEICYLMRIKHQNVVQFVGYCAESRWEAIEQPSGSGNHIWAEIPKRLLCFEYVANKSLNIHIAGIVNDHAIVVLFLSICHFVRTKAQWY